MILFFFFSINIPLYLTHWSLGEMVMILRAIFKLTSWIWFFSNSFEIDLGTTPLDPTDDKSTLVQVMAWCHQTTSLYLNQCWHRSMSPYGVTRPQWVKGCVSLDPSKISKSGWWGLQLDTWQLCNSLWYGLINSKLHINKKIFFLYHTTSDGVTCPMF